jgi:hypothetical protein
MAPWTTQASTAGPDPLTTVVGPHGTTYSCPDLLTLDGHLAALCVRLRNATPQFPSLAEAFRADIDCLLERRHWLRLTSTVDAAA